jgi:hypothetical protein
LEDILARKETTDPSTTYDDILLFGAKIAKEDTFSKQSPSIFLRIAARIVHLRLSLNRPTGERCNIIPPATHELRTSVFSVWRRRWHLPRAA